MAMFKECYNKNINLLYGRVFVNKKLLRLRLLVLSVTKCLEFEDIKIDSDFEGGRIGAYRDVGLSYHEIFHRGNCTAMTVMNVASCVDKRR